MSISQISAPPLPVETGTFVPTYTGFAAPPAGPLNYSIVGNVVTLFVEGANINVATSNSTALTIANGSIPAAARPIGTRTMVCILFDNTAFIQGMAVVNAAGGITFGGGLLLFNNNFVASGMKGLPFEWSITYPKQ